MSMLEKLKAKAAERHLFKVVVDEVVLRSAPREDAARVGALDFGRVVLLRDLRADGWAKLAEEQVWALGLNMVDIPAEEGLASVFVLVDGRDYGLPVFLKPEACSLEEWEFAEAVRCVEANGLVWKKPPGGLRPQPILDLAWLSPWHAPDGTLLEAPRLVHDPNRFIDWPLPRLCIATMVRGARPASLESLILLHHSAGFERVVIYFDAGDDPSELEAIRAVEKFSQPVPTGPDGLLCTALAVQCTRSWWQEVRRNSRYYRRQHEQFELYRQTVQLDAEVHDVQARQMLVVEHALMEAQADRFHWLLHVDADEVLFCPDEERHLDARKFFHEVPLHFTCVRFANLEAVPETLEVDDEFRDVTLFKMNPALLEELGVEPRILPCGDIAPEDDHPEQDLFDASHADAVPGGQPHGFTRLPRKERHALRRLLAAMHDIAEKRSPVLDQLKVQLDKIEYPVPEDDDSDWSDDESCFGPRPHCPAYFNSYSNGKCAVRTEIGPRGELPPLPAGVHGFVRDGGSVLFTLLCKGPGAPVVLHYANCGFTQWKKKYGLLCKGHGTADGAFSTVREGITEVRSHMATRQLSLRGNNDDLERFYRVFVQGNEFDELAFLAQFGIVLRLEGPRRRLEEAQKRFAELELQPRTVLPAKAPDNIPRPGQAWSTGGAAVGEAEDADALASKRPLGVARPRRHGEEA